ncbi:hypothetical protein FOT80_16160, partial [Serratia fonticola]|nr:hypothetical protein [Serratia fonticola]
MAKRFNTNNARPSNSMKDLNDNALAYDDFINSDADDAVDRFGKPFPTVRNQVALRIDELVGASQNAIESAEIAKAAAEEARLAATNAAEDAAAGATIIVLDRTQQALDAAISAIGWQELGDWVVNLIINNRDQVVWCDNAWYKYIGELPHTIVGDSPEADGGIWSDSNPSGKWVNIGDAALRNELASYDTGRGASIIALEQGGAVQDAIKWITPRTTSNPAADNYAVLQAAADTGLNIDLKAHDIYISHAIQLKPGQRVRGQKSPNFSTSNITRVICNTPGGGCFWYTNDTSKLQVSMPQIDHVGMIGDYPIRFNNEQTAIIVDGAASNVPFGMRPCVRFCDINPRVNGIGIGISWSKMFNGIITCCEMANFDID